MRAETTPMEFGSDWRGVFIRGDVAMGYRMALEGMLQIILEVSPNDPRVIFAKHEVKGLIELLADTQQGNSKTPVQIMKPYDQCLLKRERWWEDEGTQEINTGDKPQP